MTIRFTKAPHGDKSHTLTCIRDDGTVTGMRSSDFFILHDLTHYAVETVLGFSDAFYGLLSQGWAIESFEERQPGTRKVREMPYMAGVVEVIVGAVNIELNSGRQDEEAEQKNLRDAFGALGAPSYDVTPAQFAAIRARRDEFLTAWRGTAPGGVLELCFPLA